ncbi:trimethyltridecatetraene synthase-like [Lycium ferocissimum]|uniref:trimethyltridecatetraene synthase-like n=1 Tax=Lycium ferocissimum TaxID=112874 RepID=UPI002815102D|nr:trimethyltridecatetraene synthase-like [Lycium ferocissimum]
MENSGLVLAFTGLLITSLFLSRLFNGSCRKQNLPPGPKPWPIVGNLHLLGSVPHRSLHELAERYGDLMLLKLGSRNVLIASSPDMAREFLKTNDAIWASRPELAAGKYTAYNYRDMTWAPYGPFWRQARRIYLNEIFNPKRLDSFEYIRVEERRNLISRLFDVSVLGKPIVLRNHLTRYTLTNISRTVLSGKYFSELPGQNSTITLEKLQDMLDMWFLLNGVINIGDWIPWLAYLDLQGYVKQMKELHRNFDKFHNFVLDDHKAKREEDKNFVPRDMVDVLLQQAEDPNLEVQLTNDCVKGLMQDLLAGGTDTSATTVEWAFHELLRQPNIMKKAQEELDVVIGQGRWVQEKDYTQLPYIESIIKETLRLHPVSTMLPPRTALEDCHVAGYDIPKGTILMVNTWSIGRNSGHWESPGEFIPERFEGKEDIDIAGQHFALLPFGSGRRKCPGYSLGIRIIRATLANLLHGFNWRLPDGINPQDINMDEIYGLTTHPKVALHVIMEPRLPDNLYK